MAISFGVPTNLAVSGTLTVGGTATVASTLTLSSTTASSLLYGNASKGVSSVVLSSNLTLTTGTLALAAALTGINSITAGSAIPLTLSGGSSGASLVLGNTNTGASLGGGGLAVGSSASFVVGATAGVATNAVGVSQISASSNTYSSIASIAHSSTNGNHGFFVAGKSRGTKASPTILADGDVFGEYAFTAYDGAAYRTSANIQAIISGTPGAGDLPTRLAFSVAADGSGSATERMTITPTGNLLIGTTTDSGARVSALKAGTSPASSGTISTAAFRAFDSNNVALDVGVKSDASPFPGWIQVHDTANQATNYPLSLQGNGSYVTIGTLASATVGNGGLYVGGTATSTSTTSGALQVGGGIGVAGDANIGGNIGIGPVSSSNTARKVIRLNEGGYADPAAPGSTSYGDKLILQDPGAFYRSAIGFNGSGHTWFQGAAFAWWTGAAPTNVMSLSGAGVLNIPGTTSATSSTVGALTIGNGTAATNVAIGGGNIAAGANVHALGNINVGPQGSDFSAGRINLLSASDTVPGLNFGVTNYGFGVLEKTDGNLYFSRRNGSSTNTTWMSVARASGDVSITSTTASTSTTTGALTVAGGIGVAGASVFGGAVKNRIDQNAGTELIVQNSTSGTTAYSALSSYDGTYTTQLGTANTGYTTSGPFVANAGFVTSNAPAGFRLISQAGEIRFYSSNTLALTLAATTQAATFAGAVTVGGVTILKNYTVDRLPDAASYTYGEAYVSDATQEAGTSIGSAPTGGGSVVRGVYSNGSAWLLR